MAGAYIAALDRRCAQLARNPHLGRRRDGTAPGHRPAPQGARIVVCIIRPDAGGIDILGLPHQRMDVPRRPIMTAMLLALFHAFQDLVHPLEVALEPHYDLLRVLHVIAIISWMAGLLYLPRLFVYHAERGTTAEVRETFTIMEWRLLNYIMHPAMAASWATGVALLLALPGWGPHLWMIVKALSAVAMTGIHVYFAHQVRAFRLGARTHSGRFYRIINEIPTVLMIVIVVMAILHPWDSVFAGLRGEM